MLIFRKNRDRSTFYFLLSNFVLVIGSIFFYFLAKFGYSFRFFLTEISLTLLCFLILIFLLKILVRPGKISDKAFFCILWLPSGLLLFLIFLIAYLDMSPPTLTSIRSPSQGKHVIIHESCFGFGCTHTAYVVKYYLLKKYLDHLDVGDAENIVFRGAEFTWSADESTLFWTTGTRKGMKKGVLKIR